MLQVPTVILAVACCCSSPQSDAWPIGDVPTGWLRILTTLPLLVID